MKNSRRNSINDCSGLKVRMRPGYKLLNGCVKPFNRIRSTNNGLHLQRRIIANGSGFNRTHNPGSGNTDLKRVGFIADNNNNPGIGNTVRSNVGSFGFGATEGKDNGKE